MKSIDSEVKTKIINIAQSKHFVSSDLLELLQSIYPTLYQKSVGVWEGYTLQEHTIMVLNQFEKYFSKVILPQNFPTWIFRIFLALHDIGKPEAIVKGNKDLQCSISKNMIVDFMNEIQVESKFIKVLERLVEMDMIGGYLRGKISGIDLTEQVLKSSSQLYVTRNAFFKLLLIYFIVDAGSYTKDAGGKESLDKVFIFNRKSSSVKLAQEPQRKISIIQRQLSLDYDDFKKDLLKILNSYKYLGNHGTNSYALEKILQNGIQSRNTLDNNFSGEHIIKPSSRSGVSISVSEYPYYLAMGLYYAERVSRFDISNREKFFNNYQLQEAIIKSEGGILDYSKKVLERKDKDVCPNNISEMSNKILEEQRQRKKSLSIPKYLFSIQNVKYHITALEKITKWLKKNDCSYLKNSIDQYTHYAINVAYFVREFAVRNKKAIITEDCSFLLKEAEIMKSSLNKGLSVFNSLNTKERDKIVNTYPVVILFDTSDMEMTEVTSKILCERVVEKIPLEKIICIFVTQNILKKFRGKYTFEVFDIEMLYRHETEKMQIFKVN